MANQVSVSSAPIAKLGNKMYYDLVGTIQVMKKIYEAKAVDGFELQIEAEWDKENPPLTDRELADWTNTPKYSMEEIITLVQRENLPILSVHSSRDIGNYLCSEQKQHRTKGKNLIRESLLVTQELGAKVCVFHLWNTWATKFDINVLRRTLADVARQFPRVKASVENIPTHLEGQTPFSLVKTFGYVTLDLRWAALYDELHAFQSIIEKIADVHMRGTLEGDKWILNRSPFTFYEALQTIMTKWRSTALLTVEPEGGVEASNFANFVKAMKALKD
jgi:hypothetical protein